MMHYRRFSPILQHANIIYGIDWFGGVFYDKTVVFRGLYCPCNSLFEREDQLSHGWAIAAQTNRSWYFCRCTGGNYRRIRYTVRWWKAQLIRPMQTIRGRFLYHHRRHRLQFHRTRCRAQRCSRRCRSGCSVGRFPILQQSNTRWTDLPLSFHSARRFTADHHL